MRRDLFASLMNERKVRSDNGAGAVKIADLGLYPDDLIELLTPVLRPEYKPSGDPPFVSAVSLMNGERTIREVADQLECLTGWTRERAFQYTRGVFLHLVATRWCVPSR